MNNYDDLCKCGHMRKHHIYCEGACRPGSVCQDECEKFVHFEETETYGKDHREEGLEALKELNQIDKSDCCSQQIDNAHSLVAEF